jgi:hypothetical protein
MIAMSDDFYIGANAIKGKSFPFVYPVIQETTKRRDLSDKKDTATMMQITTRRTSFGMNKCHA